MNDSRWNAGRKQYRLVSAEFFSSFSMALALFTPTSFCQERVSFFLNDAQGTPVVALSVAGDVVWRGDYDPFGDLISQTGELPTNRRWRGHYFDEESGLLAVGRRHYHPTSGRFLSSDPALVGSLPPAAAVSPLRLNAYAYGMNNPLRFMDPTGLFAIESKTLQQSKEFHQATRLVARTQEGSRLLWALDFANVQVAVSDFPLSADYAGKVWGAIIGQQVPMNARAEWDYFVFIDYSFILKQPNKVKLLAQVLYHELRRVEIDVETWDFDKRLNRELHEALSINKGKTSDAKQALFERQLKTVLKGK